MKKETKSKIRLFLTELRISEYIRQLSIVVVGIIITFAGSDWINEYNTQKKLKKALQLVKSELILNRQGIKEIAERYEEETRAGLYLKRYKPNPLEANPDSMEVYLYIPFQMTKFGYNEDAMAMLKNSTLVQQIANQEIALELIKTYNEIAKVSGNFNFYADNKKECQDALSKNPAYKLQYSKLIENNASPSEKYQCYVKYLEFEDLYNLPINCLDPNQFPHAIKVIDKMIERLNKEYDLK